MWLTKVEGDLMGVSYRRRADGNCRRVSADVVYQRPEFGWLAGLADLSWLGKVCTWKDRQAGKAGTGGLAKLACEKREKGSKN
jgi:hypothetical protein